MHIKFRTKLEMFARVREFGVIYASLFPQGSRGAELFAALKNIITELQTAAGIQASSRSSERTGSTSRAAARAVLLANLNTIILAAKALAVETPALKNKFRAPRGASDQVLLAMARAFVSDATLYKDRFIAFGAPADFLEELETNIVALEKALVDKRTARNSRVTATAAMEAALEQGVNTVQQLKAVINYKLGKDEAVMTAWRRASRSQSPPHFKSDSDSEAGTGTDKEAVSNKASLAHNSAAVAGSSKAPPGADEPSSG